MSGPRLVTGLFTVTLAVLAVLGSSGTGTVYAQTAQTPASSDMYYHHRPLRYVSYGRVGPPPVAALSPDFATAYRWLGQYCGYFPQVWLSRSRSAITGSRRTFKGKRVHPDGVLFGFESIHGFPLAYEFWCELLCSLVNSKDLDQANKAVQDYLAGRGAEPDSVDPVSLTWQQTPDVLAVLSKHLFVKYDQVVVPYLNLKAAKIIFCRNETQKRALRRMGFIEDRLLIRI